MSAANDLLGTITEFVRKSEKKPKTARYILLAAAQILLPDERIRVCNRVRVPVRESVDIMYNDKRQNARYVGLMHCGLGWVCPCCALRLSEERRSMLERAFENARGKYTPFMATYTVQHTRRQSLSSLLDAMHKAYTAMRKDRHWKQTKEEWSICGEIRATEITYSYSNGFHPHYHVVMLSSAMTEGDEQKFFADTLENQLWIYWTENLSRQGLTASREHGIDVQDASFVSHYVTKGAGWSLDKEMSRTVTKSGRLSGNMTPMDLLILYACGDKMSGEIFKEYARATKGKSALQWSPGLKALLGVDASKEEIETWDDLDDEETLLAKLSDDEWKIVLRCGASGKLLDVASTGDYEQVAAFLTRLYREVSTYDA